MARLRFCEATITYVCLALGLDAQTSRADMLIAIEELKRERDKTRVIAGTLRALMAATTADRAAICTALDCEPVEAVQRIGELRREHDRRVEHNRRLRLRAERAAAVLLGKHDKEVCDG